MADYNRIKASSLTLSSALSSHVDVQSGRGFMGGAKTMPKQICKGRGWMRGESFVVRCE